MTTLARIAAGLSLVAFGFTGAACGGATVRSESDSAGPLDGARDVAAPESGPALDVAVDGNDAVVAAASDAADGASEAALRDSQPVDSDARGDVVRIDVVVDTALASADATDGGALDAVVDVSMLDAVARDVPIDAPAIDVTATDTPPNDASAPDASADARTDASPVDGGGGGVVTLRCPIRDAPVGRPPAVGTPGDFTRIPTVVGWDYTESCENQDLCAATDGVTYEIGTGRAYTNPRDVPWLNLRPCDQVLLYYRATPYNDIIYVGARGEAGRAIVIRGVAGPNGERPALDGNDAVMPQETGANSYVDSLGQMEIVRPLAHASIRYGYRPGHLLVSGLTFQNTKAPAHVTDLTGTTREWGIFTAGIYALGVDHLTVNDCEFKANGLGLFINSTNGEPSQSREILVRGNYFHDNGTVNNFYEHNAYTEAIGIIYEYNYFAPPLSGSGGDNIKERSAGNIFRYNYIHGGVNLISLRDPQSNRDNEAAALDVDGQRQASRVFVYGNLFAATEGIIGRNNSAIVSVGDGPCPTGCGEARAGTVYFYNNRTYASLPHPPAMYFAQSVPLFTLLNTRSPITVSAVDNLFDSVNVPFALFYYQGIADWHDNWINAFQNTFTNTAGGTLATGTLYDGTGLGGLSAQTANPGFVDAAGGNYLTTPASPYASLAGALPAEVIHHGLLPIGQPVVTPFGL